MSANPSQKENWFAGFTTGSAYVADNRQTGKYYAARSIAASAGSIDVSGEGYGAILIGNTTNLFITASNGEVVPTAQFETKRIYEIGIKGIKQGGTGNCTIFKVSKV